MHDPAEISNSMNYIAFMLSKSSDTIFMVLPMKRKELFKMLVSLLLRLLQLKSFDKNIICYFSS